MKTVLLNSFFDDRKIVQYMKSSGKTKRITKKRTIGADFLPSKNI